MRFTSVLPTAAAIAGANASWGHGYAHEAPVASSSAIAAPVKPAGYLGAQSLTSSTSSTPSPYPVATSSSSAPAVYYYKPVESSSTPVAPVIASSSATPEGYWPVSSSSTPVEPVYYSSSSAAPSSSEAAKYYRRYNYVSSEVSVAPIVASTSSAVYHAVVTPSSEPAKVYVAPSSSSTPVEPIVASSSAVYYYAAPSSSSSPVAPVVASSSAVYYKAEASPVVASSAPAYVPVSSSAVASPYVPTTSSAPVYGHHHARRYYGAALNSTSVEPTYTVTVNSTRAVVYPTASSSVIVNATIPVTSSEPVKVYYASSSSSASSSVMYSPVAASSSAVASPTYVAGYKRYYAAESSSSSMMVAPAKATPSSSMGYASPTGHMEMPKAQGTGSAYASAIVKEFIYDDEFEVETYGRKARRANSPYGRVSHPY